MKTKAILTALVLVFVLVFATTSIAQDPRAPEDLPGTGWWTSFTLQAVNGDATFQAIAKDANTANEYNANGCSVSDGASVIYNPNLAPNFGDGSRIGFADDCGAAGVDNVADGFQGGVTVSSDSQLVAVVSVGNNPAGNGGIAGGTASAFYQGVDGQKADTTLNFPVAKNNFFDQTTTFYIQAVEDANVTLTYATGEVDGPHAIAAGETRVFSPDDASVPDSTNASAVATSSTGAIVGTVVEHPDSATPATFALSTRAFVPAEADTTVYLPSVKNEFFGGTTGAAVQAVGGQVTVEVDFAITNAASGATCTDATSAQVVIDDGDSAIFGGGADRNLPAGFGNGCFGSATVRVVGGTGSVVATVNETSGIGKAVYSGFPASAAATSVAVPLAKEDFFAGRTSIVVQAVGASSETTAITANYVNDGACASGCEVAPASGAAGSPTTAGGSAVNFRQLNNFSAQYSGTLPAIGTNNAVTISSTNLPVVAIAQEAVTGLDVKNYEGFPLN